MKTVAMIAHDGKKADMVAFATFNREKLAGYHIIATGTTGRLLQDKVGLEVEALLSETGQITSGSAFAGMLAGRQDARHSDRTWRT